MLVRGGPEDPQEFRKREGINERLPSLRRTIVLMFILCAIPCIAPLAVLFGLAWYFMNREAIKALPSLYTGLCKIALAVGVCQSVLMIVLVLLYGAVRNP
jgi:fatty acid desaturase